MGKEQPLRFGGPCHPLPPLPRAARKGRAEGPRGRGGESEKWYRRRAQLAADTIFRQKLSKRVRMANTSRKTYPCETPNPRPAAARAE